MKEDLFEKNLDINLIEEEKNNSCNSCTTKDNSNSISNKNTLNHDYSNEIISIIEDESYQNEYVNKINSDPLSLFEFMTEERLKQWEEKLFNSHPQPKKLINSKKSDEEIFNKISNKQLKEKQVINNDSIRTRSRESILLPNFKSILNQSIQYFCLKAKADYKQGLNELFGPLILLKYKFKNLPLYYIINIVSAMIDKFLPNYFYEKTIYSLKSAMALFQILLKYQEPMVYNKLELANIKPELYSMNWLINYQSAKFPLDLFFYFWDKMLTINDNLFIQFFLVALIQYHKDIIINTEQNYLHYIIANLPIKSDKEIDLIFNKALELRNNTPYSFRLWANKIGFLRKNNKDVKNNYEKYQPDLFMALPIFPSEIIYSMYNTKMACYDPRCVNYINNLIKVSPNLGFKKRDENIKNSNSKDKINFQYKDKLYFLKQLQSKEKEHICEKCTMKINKTFNYFLLDIRMKQFNDELSETGILKENFHISQEKLKMSDFSSILTNKFLNQRGNYHFIFLSSETDTFNNFEKKYYKDNLTEEDEMKILFGFMQPIIKEKELNFEQAKKYLNSKETFKLKEYDNMKKSISSMIKNNFPYVGYIYGGYEQIHRECKRFKIKLDKHNEKKCFYCKNKNGSINDEININKKKEEEEKCKLYEDLWEKKEKINYDNLSFFLNDPNLKIFLGVLKEYKTEFIEQDKIQILISESFDKFQLGIYKFNNEKQFIDLENTLMINYDKENSIIEDNKKNLELTLLEKISINNIISICLSPKNKNIVDITIKEDKGENVLNKSDKNKNSGRYNIVIDFSSEKISKNFIITFKSLINLYKSSKRKK